MPMLGFQRLMLSMKGAGRCCSPTMPRRCLTWMVDTTARRASKREPSAVSTPTARPPSRRIRRTGFEVITLPPASSITAARASGSRIDPPRGVVQPERCRPATSEKARSPLPGWSMASTVMNAIQAKNARTWGSSKRSLITSRALHRRIRSIAGPIGLASVRAATSLGNRGGLARSSPTTGAMSSQSASRLRYALAS